MPPRRILLVDDQRETTRMLRTMLEFLDRGHVVVEVPSGEEALLEVRRGPFDLLVTDVRLPGISGLELVGRVRKANPSAQVIIISGLPNPELRDAARELEADAFFTKPLETDSFLEAVNEILSRERPGAPAVAEPGPAGEPPDLPQGPASIAERLLLLRRDLGALAIFLVDGDGQVVMSAGDVARLKLENLLHHLVVSFSASLNICAVLGGSQPANVQFFDGKDFDLYTINAGPAHLLVIVYDGERGARSMGAVMNYGRPCAEELRGSLAALNEGLFPPTPAAPPSPTGPLSPAIEQPIRLAEIPLAVAEPELAALLEQNTASGADAFWQAALAESLANHDETSGNSLSYEQALTLGLLPKDDAG